MDFSIILPSYNDYKNLKNIIPELVKVFEDEKVSYEILIILKNNKLKNKKKICNNVYRIFREKDNSFGSALRTGISYAKGNYIITIDADGSHNPYEIKKIFKFYSNYDLIAFSRYIKNGSTHNNLILRSMSFVLNMIFKITFKIQLNDISNNFKIYRTSLIKNINLISQNFDIIEEIIIKLSNKNKLRIKEVESTFRKRKHGVTKRSLIKFILSFLLTYIKLIKFKYFQSN